MGRLHGVGIIGAGDISASYLRWSRLFGNFEIRAIASRTPASAQARGREFETEALSIDALLARDDITAVVNLTPPASHFSVSRDIVSANKHVYSEKPFVPSLDEGRQLLALAQARGLTVASAPDTFLGGAHQAVRQTVDAGMIGAISGGTCQFMNAGMEHRHPNPAFFFAEGGGPVLDIAPYYVTALVNLLGPVRQVAAFGTKGAQTRLVSAPGPNHGRRLPVDVNTTVHGVLEFHSGPVVSIMVSWDVPAHGHPNHIELYGSRASLYIPDPDFFGGQAVITGDDGSTRALSPNDHPFGPDNEFINQPQQRANYRGAGLADMLAALETGREPRCNATLALHVIDILTGLNQAAAERRVVTMTTSCSRPDSLTAQEARTLLARTS
ncbi:MAG: hypothetical protein ABS75_10440 [Pelagibacterium sp. SCN 63-23]|nr:MAG: hypothetical protein ABS75_10440 [Pelagibacterium sp. SCN 63-23]